jgi:hypothetical protein
LVSINGVIQKPVAGTGQPSEGFSVDGTDIILGDAPATGSDFFILTFKSLGVSEPADNSVTSAKIVDGAIVNADINASAAIAGTKIDPSFTSNITVSGTDPRIIFTDTNNNPDFTLHANGGVMQVENSGTGTQVKLESNGSTTVFGNLTANADLTVDTNTLHVDSTNNRVGIGTSSPAAKLHVVESTSIPAVKIKSGLSTNQNASLTFLNDNEGGLLHLGVFGSSATTFGANEATDAFITANNQLSINAQNNSGQIRFGIGSTPNTKMIIDSSGRVAIGTSTTNTSDRLTIVDPGDAFMSIRSDAAADNTNQILDFAVGTANRSSTNLTGVIAATIHSQSGGTLKSDLKFSTNAGNNITERMRIDSSGNIRLPFANNSTGLRQKIQFVTEANFFDEVGYIAMDRTAVSSAPSDMVFATGTAGSASERMRIQSGGGISFNGDTAAANALDDYEEGTFTVGFVGATEPSWYNKTATYVKIGQLVHIDMWLQASSTTSSTSSIFFTLPYVASSTSNRPTSGVARVYGLRNWGSQRTAYGFLTAGSNRLNMMWVGTGSNPSNMNMNLWQSGGEIHVSISYRTN